MKYFEKQAKFISKLLKNEVYEIDQKAAAVIDPYKDGKLNMKKLNMIKEEMTKQRDRGLKAGKLEDINKYEFDKLGNIYFRPNERDLSTNPKWRKELDEKGLIDYSKLERLTGRLPIDTPFFKNARVQELAYEQLLKQDKNLQEHIRDIEKGLGKTPKYKNPLYFKNKITGLYEKNKARYVKNYLIIKEIIQDSKKFESLKQRLEEQGKGWIDTEETGFQILDTDGNAIYKFF